MDIVKMKMKAVEYLRNSGLVNELEKCLNDLIKSESEDLRGFVSKYFEDLSLKRQITSIEALSTYGQWGMKHVRIKISGKFRNESNQILSDMTHDMLTGNICGLGALPNIDIIKQNDSRADAIIDLINKELSVSILDFISGDIDRNLNIQSICEWLRCDWTERHNDWLSEIDKSNQQTNENSASNPLTNQANNKAKPESGGKKSGGKKGGGATAAMVVTPDDPPEQVNDVLHAHWMLCCSLQDSIGRINCSSDQSVEVDTSMPRPCIPMLTNGRGRPGKCNLIRRCLLTPIDSLDNPQSTANDLRIIHQKMCSILQSNAKATFVQTTCYGEIIPSYDRAEQYIELIREAIDTCELDVSRYGLILDIDARTLFDLDKGKYEVWIGQFKSGEELTNTLTELVDKYSGFVIGLIEPIRYKDAANWMKISQSVSDRCLVLGRAPHGFKSPRELCTDGPYVEPQEAPLVEPQLSSLTTVSIAVPSIQASGVCVPIDKHALLTDYLQYHQLIGQEPQQLILWTEVSGCSVPSWYLPLACSMRAQFVLIPDLGKDLAHWSELSPTYHPDSEREGIKFPAIYTSPEPAEIQG